MWAEIQRENARQVRDRQQQSREFQRAQARAARDAASAERDRMRQAAVDDQQRRLVYLEDRQAEATAMAGQLRARLAELEGLLRAGADDRHVVTFADLRRTGTYPAFGAPRRGESLHAPQWEHFAPEEPPGRGRFFGGAAAARYEQQLASARADYDQAVERYTAAEADRRRQFEQQRAAHDAFAVAVAEHNAAVDQFQRDCR